MRFLLGLLWGYCIRAKKSLLVATLTAIAETMHLMLTNVSRDVLR